MTDYIVYYSDLGHEDLCKHVINDLNMYGLSVIDDFLGRHKGLEILNEVHHMYTAGVFKVKYFDIYNYRNGFILT